MRPSARCSSLKNFAFYYICNRAELPKLRIFAFCYICDNGGCAGSATLRRGGAARTCEQRPLCRAISLRAHAPSQTLPVFFQFLTLSASPVIWYSTKRWPRLPALVVASK